MPKNRPSNIPSVLSAAAKREIRRLDDALRAEVGENPTEEDVLAAFPKHFPGSHMGERQIGQYARSVIAGRPHFV